MNVKATLLSEDAFSWRALGKNGLRVYAALREHPGGLLPGSLMDLLRGPAPSTINRALRRLEGAGLARLETDGRWIGLTADLAAVASRYGVQGRGEARAREFAVQREQYRLTEAARVAIHQGRTRGSQ